MDGMEWLERGEDMEYIEETFGLNTEERDMEERDMKEIKLLFFLW